MNTWSGVAHHRTRQRHLRIHRPTGELTWCHRSEADHLEGHAYQTWQPAPNASDIRNGDVTLTANTRWETNGTSCFFLEGDGIFGEQSLAPETPKAQKCSIRVEGAALGRYDLRVVLVNAAGETSCDATGITIR